jgi:hypothetical protein
MQVADIVTFLVVLFRKGRVEQLCIEEPVDLLIRKTLLSQGFHQCLDPTPGEANLFGPGFCAASG